MCKDSVIVASAGNVAAYVEVIKTYLVIYGSGWTTPTLEGKPGDMGAAFEKLAMTRREENKKMDRDGKHTLVYCPTDIDFFKAINGSVNIVRLDVYCHGSANGLNLGGYMGKRMDGSVRFPINNRKWWDRDEYGRDLRRVDINRDIFNKNAVVSEKLKNLDRGFKRGGNELQNLNPKSFADTAEVYFWGCNIGGQYLEEKQGGGKSPKLRHVLYSSLSISNPKHPNDPKASFAQKFAEQMGKGVVWALVGKVAADVPDGDSSGGSVLKTRYGKLYYGDGEMLPANAAANHSDPKNTRVIQARKHMEKFTVLKKIFIFSVFVLCMQAKIAVSEDLSLTSRCNAMHIDRLKNVTAYFDMDYEELVCFETKRVGSDTYLDGDSLCKRILVAYRHKKRDEILPCLIEKIKDTTFIAYHGRYKYTVSDNAIRITVEILGKHYNFKIVDFMERELQLESAGAAIQKHNSAFVYNTPQQNYKNRLKYYDTAKKIYEKKKKQKR